MNFLKKIFSKNEPKGIVTTTEMDELLGDNKSIDVTDLLKSQIAGGRLEIKNEKGEVILRIPNPDRFPEVWPELFEE